MHSLLYMELLALNITEIHYTHINDVLMIINTLMISINDTALLSKHWCIVLLGAQFLSLNSNWPSHLKRKHHSHTYNIVTPFQEPITSTLYMENTVIGFFKETLLHLVSIYNFSSFQLFQIL